MRNTKIGILVHVLAAALALCATTLGAQSLQGSVDWLSLGELQKMNLHLPSYIASAPEQIAYQTRVPLHQEITLAWSAEGEHRGFVFVKRWQHMQKSAAAPVMKGRVLLVVAATPGGEIRAFALCPDARSTNARVDIQLPQDGQISRLIILSPSENLERIGEVELSAPDGTPHILSSQRRNHIRTAGLSK